MSRKSTKTQTAVLEKISLADDLLSKAVKEGYDSLSAGADSLLADATRLKSLPEHQLSKKELGMRKVAKAVKRGAVVVDLPAAIGFGGTFLNRLPKLAVAPYRYSIEGKPIYVKVSKHGAVIYEEDPGNPYSWDIYFPKGTFPKDSRSFLHRIFSWNAAGKTVVPFVPPELRDDYGSETLILFEVSKWELVRVSIDPYLIRRLAGDLYEVLGTWDVSQIELDAYQQARQFGI